MIAQGGPSESPRRYCGRVFAVQEIGLIRGLIEAHPSCNRRELASRVCEALGWRRPDGRPKEMSCRVAMLRMHREGLLELPPPLKGNGNGRRRPRITSATDPRSPLRVAAGALGELTFRAVQTPEDSKQWNEWVERYHYLGYAPLPGAQVRYLVFGGEHLLAVMGFAAAAWAVAPRDRFIGWSREQRVANLHRVVNNARFLILPWVQSPNLASRILSTAVRRLPQEWETRYAYRPVLLETFVDRQRYRGTCYRAANWKHVGRTQGRGKLDRHFLRALPVKDIYLYPLCRDYRQVLCATS